MAMAAAFTVSREIVPALPSTTTHRWDTTRSVFVSTQKRFVSHCISGQHVRRWAAAGCYGTPARDIEKLSRSTGEYYFDLAIDKAIQHYHKHIKEKDGRSIMVYPLRGANECLSSVEMFHILLGTTGGQKYVCIYVGPMAQDSIKLDDGALKLVVFRKVDNNVSLPFHRVVGDTRWPVSPRNDPLITAAARFALAQHNKEEKLANLIRANSQMVGEHEIFRMTFKAELSGNYDAIVLVPRNNPEKMELVMFKISDGWGMYGQWMLIHGSRVIVPDNHKISQYSFEAEAKVDVEVEVEDGYQFEDDGRIIDDSRVTIAARFALAQHNKKDQVRRVVEATRRTYLGNEILSMRFDGELDGSRFYQAIVSAPVSDPENMRLLYVGRNGDEYDRDDPDNYLGDVDEEFDVDEDGFDECSIDDPCIVEAARLALNAYNKKDKLLRVVKAASQEGFEYKTYRVRFVGEDHPLRTYVAILSVDPKGMRVEYVSPEVYPK